MPDKTDRKTEYDRKSRSRHIAAVVLMLLAFTGSVLFMNRFMCIPFSNDEIRSINFHKEPENSIDVLLVGSSATYSDFASAYAYEKFGFTSYPYAIGGSTCTMWKPALRDALDTQRPKLVVVDVFGGGYEQELIDTRNNQLSIVLSNTAWSKEKVETARELTGIVERTSTASFLFPIIKYHNNIPNCVTSLPDRLWLEFAGPSPLKGIDSMTRTRWLPDVDPSSFSDETLPLDPKTEAVIKDFIAYCDAQDIELLFVKYPSVLTDVHPDEMDVNLRANSILKLAEENGCRVFNMQKHFHDIGLIETKDFYNNGHTNTRGQKKVTEYLGNYLQTEMGVAPSELNERDKALWDEAVRYWHAYEKTSEEMIEGDIIDDLGDDPEDLRYLSGLVE